MYFWTKSRTEQETIGTRRDEFVLFILKYIFHWEKLEKCVVFVFDLLLWIINMMVTSKSYFTQIMAYLVQYEYFSWIFLNENYKSSIRIWIFISLKTVHNDVIDTSIYYSSFMSVVYDTLKTFNNFFLFRKYNSPYTLYYFIICFCKIEK